MRPTQKQAAQLAAIQDPYVRFLLKEMAEKPLRRGAPQKQSEEQERLGPNLEAVRSGWLRRVHVR